MDVLVIGGSVFLGRAVVAEALSAGAVVTVFNRGKSGPTPPGAEQIVGDRTSADDLAQLAGRRFDVVVDTSGYVPADVALSAGQLADSCGHYAFVSTISVFPDWPAQLDYDARPYDGNPDATRVDLPDGMDEAAAYGWLKAGCELAVLRAFGEQHCAVLRAGLIVGPHDSSVARLPWWIDRVARGGEVLAPGRPEDPMSCIDARDLAQFALAGAAGTFETPGPAGRDTRADLMAACAAATGSDAALTYVADDWLAAQDVEGWTEVPLWVPGTEGPATFVGHTAAAEAAGLRWRPLADTVADTWAWMNALPQPWHPSPRTPGLAPDREAELLAAWHER
jgi:nucleoside-diphosphate-sugar epimerase